MIAKMFVWKVKLEVKSKFVVTSKETGKVLRTSTDIDQNEYNVASSSGYGAIKRAEYLALHEEAFIDDWSDAEEIFNSAPVKVVDVVELVLENELDG